MIDWERIDRVFLDMDGTLFDLNFDNHFWQEFVPLRYAEMHGLGPGEAKRRLASRFKAMEGRLEWYCLDYWSEELHLDLAGLKEEVAGLIAIRKADSRQPARVVEGFPSIEDFREIMPTRGC